ncbi:hypothetical protein Z043_110529 [Scleropages formosus]|uniref:Alpha-N-acetylgalactosaminide alpha-2,6-sialyltransferase 3-like n=1 Tax=Scleropages formosus TaxID=113540 RepID=A0A0P7X264_SCLFO|nr:hypothetical protein Z043_110529 [Scleropages formosus]
MKVRLDGSVRIMARGTLWMILSKSQLYCDVCSVVSSSGQMLGRLAGPEIDSASCVWRMNNAPTRGFERDVGRRTTLRVVSHTSVPLLLQRQQHFFGQANDTVYVIWGPLRNMRRDGKGIVYNMLRQVMDSYPQARIFVTTEERMNYCDRVFKEETGKDRSSCLRLRVGSVRPDRIPRERRRERRRLSQQRPLRSSRGNRTESVCQVCALCCGPSRCASTDECLRRHCAVIHA